MRYIGLDLGTKTLGVSITDKTNSFVRPLKVINFKFEDYEAALSDLLELLKEYEVKILVLGLPKNMDGSLGFASKRSMNFKKMLEEKGYIVELEDERLSTKMAEDVIHDSGNNILNTKNKIDCIAACIILESYLKRCKNDFEK